MLPLLLASALLASPRGSFAALVDETLATSGLPAERCGILFRSLDTGEVLYARNADRPRRPASNAKLFVAAAALLALGPDYRFQTRVGATGRVVEGELRGDLVVEGRGDPTISGRFTSGDVLAIFRRWAGRLRDLGIRGIRGRVVGIDGFFQGPSIGEGWHEEDLPEWYAAETSALTYNDGCVDLYLQGTEPGKAARLRIDPPTRYVRVRCGVRTVARDGPLAIRIHRPRDASAITLTGTIPAGRRKTVWASVPNPTLYFATVLRETLARQGIPVGGRAVDADDLPRPLPRVRPLFVHRSPPLARAIEVILKRSQNHYAENVARTIAAEMRGRGTMEEARRAIAELLAPYGVPRDAVYLADGSGLSDGNRATARAIVRLLDRYRSSPHFRVFHEALPVAGVDGSLRRRMKGPLTRGRIRAKTGTIDDVRCLSGYAQTLEGETIAFSFLADGPGITAAAVDAVTDRILRRLVELPRRRSDP